MPKTYKLNAFFSFFFFFFFFFLKMNDDQFLEINWFIFFNEMYWKFNTELLKFPVNYSDFPGFLKMLRKPIRI